MALQVVTATLTAASSATFTFTKPLGNYAKDAGLTVTDALPGAAFWFAADVDNGNGTMTGTINLAAAVTGTAEIWITDKP